MSKGYTNRKITILALFIFIGLVYIIRLFYLQIIDKSTKISASQNALRYFVLHPPRGIVYDRNGKILVFNEASYDLMVVPNQVKEFDTNDLCNILKIDKIAITERLLKARTYSIFASSVFEKQISKEMYGNLEEKLYKFPGFYVQSRTVRTYPTPVAAHTLGYVGEVNDEMIAKNPYYKPNDYIGISGIERAYEEELRGKKGVRVTMVDVHNQEKGSYKNGEQDSTPLPGKSLWSSIDVELQAYGERLMKGKKGSIVAIEPSTGEILALVTSPSYDPNLLIGRARNENYVKMLGDSLKPLFNRALMAQYPPGSTFKIVNALIGQQEGVLKESTSFSCEGGFKYASDKILKCHRHPSPLRLSESIQHSCNAYYCKVFKAIIENKKKYKRPRDGYIAWREMVMRLGFGNKFNTDLPYELKGIVPKAEFYDKTRGTIKWKAVSIISVAVGQGEISTTPLQLANLTAIIANRGFYYPPHVIKAIGSEKNINPKYKNPIYSGIEKQYFEPVIKGMENVVLKGTARSAKLNEISIAGKTGTAQNPHGEDHSLFIAFAPANDPKIALIVVVENGGFGGVVAAPLASLFIEYYLNRKITNKELENRIENIDLIKNNNGGKKKKSNR